MTPTSISADLTYRFATDRQATLREEAAQARVGASIDRRTGDPVPPTRGPLATLRRRLAGTLSFA